MSHINTTRIITLLRRLVAIDSINPTLVPGARGEEEIARFIAAECVGAGIEARLDEVAPHRYNVVARVTGRGGATPAGRRLMLNGHLDTVGVEGMREPFAGRMEGGRLYGRGAYDMKGSLAAMLEAGAAVARQGLPAGELILAFVADEEYESLGTSGLLRRERADAAIVTEPTALEVCLAHRGFVWARIETEGRAAHGSRYEDGVDAIVRMGHVLTALDHLERHTLARRTHDLLGRASIHASTIAGGLGLSTYPDRCVIEVERRTLPGERDADIAAEMQALVDEAARAAPGLVGRTEIMLTRPPFEVSPREPIVRALAESLEHIRGRPPRFVGELPWFDAALLGAAGIPTVMFGPSGVGAHAAEEWVDLDSVVTCAEVLADVAMRFCGGP